MLRVMRQPLMALVLCLPFFLHAPDLAAQSQGQELVDKARLTTEAMFRRPRPCAAGSSGPAAS
jgi:hypothetical protein